MTFDLSHWLQQSLILGRASLAVWALLTSIGLGVVLLFFPRAAVLRWPIYAPIAGLMFVTIVALPLGQRGLAVKQFALPVALAGAVITLVSLAVRWKALASGRRLLRYLRARGVATAAVAIAVVAVSAALMTSLRRSDVRDIWGSSDFGSYWVVSEYLQDHGATAKAYAQQSTFHASDIVDHLEKHARLGCMLFLAFVGTLAFPGEVHHTIAPVLVVAIILMLGLAQCWIDVERPRARATVAALVFHPFLYFLLYFTYVSQATGVLLFLAGLLIAPAPSRQSCTRSTIGTAIISGIMIGAALLHYPSLIVFGGAFWAHRFLIGRSQPLAGRLLSPIAALLTCGTYLTQTIGELLWAARPAVPWGWPWRGPIGTLELLGVRPVLGYTMPEPRSIVWWTLEIMVAAGIAGLLWHGLRNSRRQAAAWAIAATTTVLAAFTLWNYIRHVPNATHAYVKIVSTFAIFAVLFALLGALPATSRIVPKRRRFVTGGVIALLAVGQCGALLRATPQGPVFSDDLVVLSRRLLARYANAEIRFTPELHSCFVMAVLRDARHGTPLRPSSPPRELLVVARQDPAAGEGRSTVDRQGNYVAWQEERLALTH